MAPIFIAGASALAGVAAHVAYFNRNEHHAAYALRYLQVALAIFCTAVAGLVRIGEESFSEAFGHVFSVQGSFFLGLFASLAVYRGLLSPLNKFPGPFLARFSALWYSAQVGGKANAPHVLMDLHAKYGDIVRVGPDILSIIHPEGTQAVYAHGTKCTKALWYDNDKPLTSMHTSRDRAIHDKRRRVWSPAFSDKALRGYEERIKPYSDQLLEQLGAFSGKPVDVSKWFNYFSFDVMGELAFGKPFDMLKSGEAHWAIKLLNEGMAPLGLSPPPWVFRLLLEIPGAAAGYHKFVKYCCDRLDERYEAKAEIPDIMSSLLLPYAGSPKPVGQDLSMLQGDARLIIVAGSDTTAATLTHVFYYLCKNPGQLEKLRAELAPLVEDDGSVKHLAIQSADHLNAVINEALRLSPPVQSAVYRITPPEGVQIGDVHVPGLTNVFCPQHVLARSEKIYTDASSFRPERWYSEPAMIKNKSAWAPFGGGVYGCIGRPLALMELRIVITKLLMAYDVSFAPGEDGTKLLTETKDCFTMEMAPLQLCFTPRKA